jgi:hypothetical protein
MSCQSQRRSPHRYRHGYRDGLAVAFDDKAGKLLQVFKIDGGGLIGFWANDGAEQVGSERWVRWTQ